MFSSKRVSSTVATLDSNITLVVILGFSSFIFATYIFKNLVLYSAIDLTSKYR